MKVADGLLVALVASLATFVAVQTGSPTGARRLGVPERVTASDRNDAADGTESDAAWRDAAAGELAVGAAEERVRDSTLFVTQVSRRAAWPASDLRRRLLQGQNGTYIDALLHSRDSILTRWPDRLAAPLRVWIADGGALDGWDPRFPSAVRDAFDEWTATGIPVRFTYVRDSASADVRVRFVEAFPQGISGRTIWSRDSSWWLVGGEIELAVMHLRGDAVSETQLYAIALHEVGHLLGLDHVDDPAHIMAPRVRARQLSDADRATVRLLYSVPAGSTRD